MIQTLALKSELAIEVKLSLAQGFVEFAPIAFFRPVVDFTNYLAESLNDCFSGAIPEAGGQKVNGCP